MAKKKVETIRINCAYCKHSGEEGAMGFMFYCPFLNRYVVQDYGKCPAVEKGGKFELDNRKLMKWESKNN